MTTSTCSTAHWYASQPHDDWAWMREHAPVYWDAKNEVWALTRYDDVLAIEKDAEDVLELRRARGRTAITCR